MRIVPSDVHAIFMAVDGQEARTVVVQDLQFFCFFLQWPTACCLLNFLNVKVMSYKHVRSTDKL
jgi:hypothetical protein